MNIDVDGAVASLAGQLQSDLGATLGEQLVVGIRTGGLWVAERLCAGLSLPPPAALDISYHRDDLEQRGLNPQVQPSELPLNLDGRQILLVDDVLHTGRTVRAAINELFDFGRPAAIRLAVLIDRGARELPIAPDYCAQTIVLEPGSRIKIAGPDPLTINVIPE